MTTAYTPTTWRPGIAGGTMVTADRLNKIELGLKGAYEQSENVAEYVRTPGSIVQDALNAWYGNRAASNSLSVVDFGADPTGTTDSSAAVQDAINSLSTLGGGRLTYPPGIYLQKDVNLTSNIEIVGIGATIKSSGYNVFVGLSDGGKGYGSGPSNIAFRGIRFEGDFASNRACSIMLHHSRDITFDTCKFVQCLINGHVLEFMGCKTVSVFNCTFAGWKKVDNLFRETIQLDHSLALSGNYDKAENYDGLATTDVAIRACRFVPLRVGSIDYASPASIGNHVSAPSFPEDIIIEDNKFLGLDDLDATMGSTAGGAGVIRMVSGGRRISIRRNVFEANAGSHVRAVRIFSTDVGIASGADYGDPTISGVAITPRSLFEVSITDNDFSGMSGIERNFDIVGVEMGGTAFGRHVDIQNNTFSSVSTTTNPANGARLVYVRSMNRIDVSHNKMTSGRLGIKISQCNGADVSHNTLNNITNLAIDCTDGVDYLSVMFNTMTGVDWAIRVANTSNSFSILGNVVRGAPLVDVNAAGAIVIYAATNGLIQGNLLIATSTNSKRGIYITGGGTPVASNIDISNNKTVNYATPVGLGDGLTKITQSNNT